MATRHAGQKEEPRSEPSARCLRPNLLEASNLGQIIGRARYAEDERLVILERGEELPKDSPWRRAAPPPHARRGKAAKIIALLRQHPAGLRSVEVARAVGTSTHGISAWLNTMAEIERASRGVYRLRAEFLAP